MNDNPSPAPEEIALDPEVELVARAIDPGAFERFDMIEDGSFLFGVVKEIERRDCNIAREMAKRALNAINQTRRAEVREARAAVWRDAIEIMCCEPTIRQALLAIKRRAAEDAGGPT